MKDVGEALPEPHGDVEREEEVEPSLQEGPPHPSCGFIADQIMFAREQGWPRSRTETRWKRVYHLSSYKAGGTLQKWGRVHHDAVEAGDGGGNAEGVEKPDEVPGDERLHCPPGQNRKQKPASIKNEVRRSTSRIIPELAALAARTGSAWGSSTGKGLTG